MFEWAKGKEQNLMYLLTLDVYYQKKKGGA